MEASSTSWIVGADREKSVGFTRDSAKGAAVIGVSESLNPAKSDCVEYEKYPENAA